MQTFIKALDVEKRSGKGLLTASAQSLSGIHSNPSDSVADQPVDRSSRPQHSFFI